MSDLTQLLRELGGDAELEAEYQRNPESVLDRYDLSKEERKAMLERDVDTVKKLAGIEDVHMTNSTIKAPE